MSKVYTEADLMPCAGPCERITRPGRMKAADAPGTVPRYSATKCQSCHTGKEGTQRYLRTVSEEQVSETARQAQRWNEQRRERQERRRLADEARRRNWMGVRP